MSTPINLPEEPKDRLRYMDREGNRWTLHLVRKFFVPHFVQAVRVEDGVEVVVHRSDFQRRIPG